MKETTELKKSIHIPSGDLIITLNHVGNWPSTHYRLDKDVEVPQKLEDIVVSDMEIDDSIKQHELRSLNWTIGELSQNNITGGKHQ